MSVHPSGFLALPAFRVFAVCSLVLVLKMLFLALYTGLLRAKDKRYLNPEDLRGEGAQTGDSERIRRVKRAHLNDLENLLPFFIVGLVYVLGGASPRGATIYCVTFTVARILHGWFYLTGKQPWRTLVYTVGVVCLVGMVVQVGIAVMGTLS